MGPCWTAFDEANIKVGHERNRLKTEVIYHTASLDNADLAWRVDEVRNLAAVTLAGDGATTLGVAVGRTTAGQGRGGEGNA